MVAMRALRAAPRFHVRNSPDTSDACARRVGQSMPTHYLRPKTPTCRTEALQRQYLPKRSDPHPFTQDDLDAILRRVNTGPRKTLAYRTPGDMLAEAIVATTP